MELPFGLVDIDVLSSKTQDKVPGLILVAQLMLMVVTLKFKAEQDNTSTSAESELGLEQRQRKHSEDATQEEKPDLEVLE